jgi:programmed cell death protein 4
MLQMGTGFERLFESLDDLRLDVPNARALAAKFLARAIADEILPPAFLGDAYVTATAGDIVAEARALLSVPHAAEKLQQVWHVTGAFDLPSVKRSIREDLEEYFSGGEAEEAHRGIREMGVPHFCHEVVYRALVLSLDFWPDRKRGDAAVALLGKAAAAGTISQRQAAIGFRRAANAIGDIEKDAPQARRGLAALAEACREAGVLPADFELGPLGGGTAAAAGASAGSGPASAAAAGAGTVGASAPTAAGGADGAVSGAAGRAVAPSDAW